MDGEKTYIAIDLKSFYASVECINRGLDPMTTNLVVADVSRTEKTICLAVSPALKAYHIPGRARLFEVLQKVKEVNASRRQLAPNHRFSGKSTDAEELLGDPSLELDFIAAPPRMATYMEISTKIYHIYLRFIAPEDIHVYSIDEVFMDVTSYLKHYHMTAHELARKMIQEVLQETGITATAGIGPNLFLCKVAMDVVAKHVPADQDGVRIAELTQRSYREQLWSHRPLTDFWRVGRGYAKRLEEVGIYTMGDIAKCSIGSPGDFYNEELLYRLFGVNAELLIDHAWGYEPCTIAQIKSYKPENSSVGSGQVLHCPYEASKGRLIVKEMTDLLALQLVDQGLSTDQLVLTVGYDIENLSDAKKRQQYTGAVTIDGYGRAVPKAAHGSISLKKYTSSGRLMTEAIVELYDRIVDPQLLIRRVNISANHVKSEQFVRETETFEQLDLFTNYQELETKRQEEKAEEDKEKRMQQAMLSIQKKFGKNAILKGMNLEEGATTIDRNGQIGGHKA